MAFIVLSLYYLEFSVGVRVFVTDYESRLGSNKHSKNIFSIRYNGLLNHYNEILNRFNGLLNRFNGLLNRFNGLLNRFNGLLNHYNDLA